MGDEIMINNKGFTVVELIVTFVFVMTISLGLFAIVDSYKERQQKEANLKEMRAYQNEIVKIVQDDFLNNGIVDIEGITTIEDSACKDFNQGLELTFERPFSSGSNIKYFCVGYDGIKYGTYDKNDSTKTELILYKKPLGDFVSFANDIIYSESKDMDVFTKTDGTVIKKKILSINVKMQHSDIKDPIEIKIVGVSTKLDTT